ncbi:type II glyceraldehyde-3-phosphate dehydrogenase (plasmid) [Streptomyces scopuliridis]|uniref:type II glyceraldehyde-3-phosphate dehydrogenase n=1 Tax=Streptomyces scopuliridis TaxID=452529 RepID=UPI002DD81E05|nr:type II glyceraldehyde-3-phosphate dehydrogenase [Streptomyces scopuliridis]WSB39088.1 type II glyceraldehyde-3-phosphate dehydrogenase [Streptomyces scopuliridis]
MAYDGDFTAYGHPNRPPKQARRIRVAVLGLGVIGKRVAHAVGRHPGLDLAGVAVRSPGPAALAMDQLPLYASESAAADRLRRAGLRPRGDLGDLLAVTDVIVDCGPARTGAGRAPIYRQAGVSAVFSGGERDEQLGPIIHPALNYARAVNLETCRMPSCNTTALGRLVAALPPLASLTAVVLRCATDSDKAAKGITNGAVLGGLPSHHGPDIAHLVPGLQAISAAATLPMTCGHCVHVSVTLAEMPDARPLIEPGTRLIVRPPGEPIETAAVKAALHQRRWHDRYEAVAQPLGPTHTGDRHDFWLSLDNEAVTIPDVLDVIHAVSGVTEHEMTAEETDRALGIPDPAVRAGQAAAVGSQALAGSGHTVPTREMV